MADHKDLQGALVELESLVQGDAALRDRLADPSGETGWPEVRALLALRLERASAETLESGGSVAVSEVVREIVEDDLAAGPAVPRGRMIGECDVLVLRRTPVSGLLVTNHVGRRYAIEDGAGRELGEIQHVSNPALPLVTPSALHNLADLRFDVLDRTVGQTYALRRSGDQLYILDEVGTQLGFVHLKSDEGRAGFKVISSLDRGMLEIHADADRPFRLRVYGSAGDEIGTIDRHFVGFGPLEGETNCIRFRVTSGRVSSGQTLGLLAAALMAGIDDEKSID